MRTYELVIVLKPVPEADRKKLVETVKSWLTGVKWTQEKEWGSKALKYKIKRELTGFYYDFEFEAEKVSADFEKKVLQTEGILRHLLLKKGEGASVKGKVK